ncbi:D-alanine--D-alanine ligase family protein [Paraburkholderia tropica]|uniref:D-alanine--D-alanine ligase family protein n=1 Tax=Paraburkholderia tropica TaxID=92647 RepID=UPI002AB7DE52|nr:D-alanine--D-alanine ligase [Paraburkholderia tropica]
MKFIPKIIVMEFNKLKIAVLFGGASEERDVSISSATQVIRALRRRGHEVLPFETSRGFLTVEDESSLLSNCANEIPSTTKARHSIDKELIKKIKTADVDVVFLALHGGTGEDGTIQALFDLGGIAYTGSSQLGSALAMDKDISKRLFEFAGIRTPTWLMVNSLSEAVKHEIDYPLVVKPNRQGSTVGLSVVRSAGELKAAINCAAKFDSEIMLERFIAGRELTVGVLNGQALTVGEVLISADSVFGYVDKYSLGSVAEIFPAELPNSITIEAKELAVRAHHTLKLGHYSRVDFRLDDEERLWCLEVNSLPGMTASSLLPQSAAASGVPFDLLCDQICRAALPGC